LPFPTSHHPFPSASSCETNDSISALTLTPILPETDPTFPCPGALFVVEFVEPAFGVEFEEVEEGGETGIAPNIFFQSVGVKPKEFFGVFLVATLCDGMGVR